MSTVNDAMSVWGRNYMREAGWDIDDSQPVEFIEDSFDAGYCETCAYTEYVVNLRAYDKTLGIYVTEQYYGTLYHLIEEMNSND